MDVVVAQPYGLEKDHKERDGIYVAALYETLLQELAIFLNTFHDTHHSLRYWRILLGHWLYRYTSVIFNRWHTLEQAFRNYSISSTAIFDADSYCLATSDSISFMWACNDDVWNQVLYAKILDSMAVKNLEIEKIECEIELRFILENFGRVRPKPSAKKLIQDVALRTLPYLSRETDAFIIDSYLPQVEEIKVQLSLGQVPQLWRSPKLKVIEPNQELRRQIGITADRYNGFEKFVRTALVDLIPSCYLEGYQNLLEQVRTLPWPRTPKFIFTSNNFDTDEIFKVWAASKVTQGVPYYVGQHGNNYGTLKNCFSEIECVAIGDKFLTWGWTDGNSKHTPTFKFRTPFKSGGQMNKDGGLLLIEPNTPHRVDCWDSYAEFAVWQEKVLLLVENLPEFIRKKLTIRIHKAQKWFTWSDERRWTDRFPNIRIENGSTDLAKLIFNNRLVVHSYDSTGILDTLSYNLPTICYIADGLSQVRASALPYYEQLIEKEILFHSPQMAANKIEEIWENLQTWWSSDGVQTARRNFCDRYARSSVNGVKEMSRALNPKKVD